MYRLGADPCPMCASFLDSLNGNAPHVMNKVNLVVVARSPIDRIDDFARGRGWGNLNLLSSTNNSYNSDYFAEKEDGRQDPMLTVFRRTADGIFHHWSSELFFAETEDGQHPRHVDTYWPLWNLFDLTPEGRGEDWWPQVDYG